MPTKQDGRKNNGGHSTKGHAGRPPQADPIKSKTIGLRQSGWDFLDNHGQARGATVQMLIDFYKKYVGSPR